MFLVAALMMTCNGLAGPPSVEQRWDLVLETRDAKRLESVLPFRSFRVLPNVDGNKLSGIQVFRGSISPTGKYVLRLAYGEAKSDNSFEVIEAPRDAGSSSQTNIQRILASGLAISEPVPGDDCLYFSPTNSIDLCIIVHKGIKKLCPEIWKAFTLGVPGMPFKWNH